MRCMGVPTGITAPRAAIHGSGLTLCEKKMGLWQSSEDIQMKHRLLWSLGSHVLIVYAKNIHSFNEVSPTVRPRRARATREFR